MVLPATTEDVLELLYRKKRECTEKFYDAEARGDLKEAHALQLRMQEIKSLIDERGGMLDV